MPRPGPSIAIDHTSYKKSSIPCMFWQSFVNNKLTTGHIFVAHCIQSIFDFDVAKPFLTITPLAQPSKQVSSCFTALMFVETCTFRRYFAISNIHTNWMYFANTAKLVPMFCPVCRNQNVIGCLCNDFDPTMWH